MQCTRSNGARLSYDLVDQVLERLAIEPRGADALGERDHADRQRHVADQLRPRRPRRQPDPGEFGGPAADVEQQRPPSAAAQQRRAGFDRQLRLLAAGDHIDGKPGLQPDARQEFLAVGGAAAGLGGDRPQRPHRPPRQPRGAAVQRRHCPVHRRLAQSPGVVQPLAKSDNAGKTVEHAKAAAGRRADQHAAVVGAQVERREGRRREPDLIQRRCGGKLDHDRAFVARHGIFPACWKSGKRSFADARAAHCLRLRPRRPYGRCQPLPARGAPPCGDPGGGSFNGRTNDSDSFYLGSNPSPPTTPRRTRHTASG